MKNGIAIVDVMVPDNYMIVRKRSVEWESTLVALQTAY